MGNNQKITGVECKSSAVQFYSDRVLHFLMNLKGGMKSG